MVSFVLFRTAGGRKDGRKDGRKEVRKEGRKGGKEGREGGGEGVSLSEWESFLIVREVLYKYCGLS